MTNPILNLFARKLTEANIKEVDNFARELAKSLQAKTVRNYFLLTYTPMKFWREQAKSIALTLLIAIAYLITPPWIMTNLFACFAIAFALVALINFNEFERRFFQSIIFVPIFTAYLIRAVKGLFAWYNHTRQS